MMMGEGVCRLPRPSYQRWHPLCRGDRVSGGEKLPIGRRPSKAPIVDHDVAPPESAMPASSRRDVGQVPMMFGWGFGWMPPLFVMGLMGVVAGAVYVRVYRAPLFSQTPLRDPLTVVRERYAQGLISLDEFERIVEDLIRTEDARWMTDGRRAVSPHPSRMGRLGADDCRQDGCECGRVPRDSRCSGRAKRPC